MQVKSATKPARLIWLATWMARTLAEPAFAKLARIEDAVLRTPIAEQRAALKALGAPVSAETYAGPAPRRGVMPT